MDSSNLDTKENEQNAVEEIESQDGNVQIFLAEDKMEAQISVTPPMGLGVPVSLESAIKCLTDNSVVFGLIEKSIEFAICNPGNKTIVAQGIKPENGQDAYITFEFQNDVNMGKPKELIDGRVDFYNLNLIKNVEAETVLAIKTNTTPGKNGKVVTGEEIAPKPGKDCFILPGRNVELRDHNCVAVSTMRGHVIVKGNKVSVANVYEVEGDVDFNTGNIEFNGSVIVKGSINEGFNVIADGDVEVMNVISGGNVECGGNLKVKNGIVGRNHSKIKVGGNLFTRFIENSTVEAGGDINMEEAIMHSLVTSNGSILVNGRGVIAGGKVRATKEITSKSIGAILGTITEIEAGINFELRQKHKLLLEQKKEKEANMDQAEKARNLLNSLVNVNQSLDPRQQQIVEKLAIDFDQRKSELEKVMNEINDIETTITGTEHGRVNVLGLIHSGVKVTIGTAIKHFREDQQYVTLTRSGADIVVSPFSGKLS